MIKLRTKYGFSISRDLRLCLNKIMLGSLKPYLVIIPVCIAAGNINNFMKFFFIK